MYGYADLAAIKLKDNPSSKQLASFHPFWLRTIAGQRVKLDEISLRETFLKQLRKATQIAYTLDHHDRMSSDDPNKTYRWLNEELARYLDRVRREHNVDVLQTNHARTADSRSGGPGIDPYSASANGGKEGKGRGRGGNGEEGHCPC